jgi:hypothetical protein
LDIIFESIYKPLHLLFNKIKDDNCDSISYDLFYEKYIFFKKFKISLYDTFNVLIPSKFNTKIYNYYKDLYLRTLTALMFYKLIIINDNIINIEFIEYNDIDINKMDDIYIYDFIFNKHYKNLNYKLLN